MMRKAVNNFAAMGLKPVVRGGRLEGAKPNRQYAYDHREDQGLIWDRALQQRKLEVMKTAYERYRVLQFPQIH